MIFVDKSPSPASSGAESTVQGLLDAEKQMHADAHKKALIQAGRELANTPRLRSCSA